MWQRLLACCALLAATPLFSSDALTIQRVQAHLIIGDTASACEEAARGIAVYPEAQAPQAPQALWEVWLKAVAKKGDEREVSLAWKRYAAQFPDAYSRRDVLEELAWGILSSGVSSSSPLIRSVALLGAFLGQDARGVNLLRKGLCDPNALVRASSVALASHLCDAVLQEEVWRLFQSEHNWQVRLEVIRALGKMRIARAQGPLTTLVGNGSSDPAERAAAIASLVDLLDRADRQEVARLAGSNRAGLRLLACEVIEHFELARDADLLLPLLKDHQADVRAAAWHALGHVKASIPPPQREPDPTAAITAAWALTLSDPEKGQEALAQWLTHEEPELRILAASALAATGSYGLPLALHTFAHTGDFYVRLNLALGLLGQRVLVDQASRCLARGLFEHHERWMWEERGNFHALMPSTLKHDETIPNYPEAVNQLARLEILNRLAVLKYPDTQELIRRYLKEEQWEISGMAAVLLLTEGDEWALDAVEALLHDPDRKVRLQAALILSLWGRGEEAIALLEQAYDQADRDLKEKILEGLGRAGSPASIPFLVDKMHEPYPTLRLMAAAALLQTLYH